MAIKKPAKTLADFRAEHDPSVKVPNLIRAGLASLLAEGAESWEYDSDFVRRCGISNAQMGSYRDEFKAHFVEVRDKSSSGKRVWFGDAKVATKARG